ncbi:hypothetical protein BCR42DRAFT_218409 [Absidia repens]|uniref:Uncharacterized protein n=1 Tax=Absidia repens TaxID=90262 RepID=A0A1X2IN63_9FUNG|nr:hypothetical protein BCR42DRAFT_218409 [Absidia repens]
MSKERAQESINNINDLSHAVAGVAHVEHPYFVNRLAIQKMKIEKEPSDTAFREAETKLGVWQTEAKNLETWSWEWFVLKLTCGLEEEKKRTVKGIEKATSLVEETRGNLSIMEDKLRELEEPNEKIEADFRLLTNYRGDLTSLLDDVLQNEHFQSDKELQSQVIDIEVSLEKVVDDDQKVKKVRELIKICDMALLEAILDLRQSSKESSVGKGQVYFPEMAFDALKEARLLCPELPSVEAPQEYKDEADDTGAHYSPMQRYLWDVRKRLTSLLEWCDNKVLELMEHESQQFIALGEKVDQWNMERRRLILDDILE